MKDLAKSLVFSLALSVAVQATAVGSEYQIPLENRIEGPRDLSILKIPGTVPGAPANLAMDFMAGNWVGKSGSTKIEEVWSRCNGNEWFGIIKILTGEETEIYFLNFRYGRYSPIGYLRKFGQDLNDIDKNCRMKVTDFNNFEKNKVIITMEGMQFYYQLLENGNLKTFLHGQSVELQRN